MNNLNFMSPKAMAGAALIGLVGAAGVFIYEQVYAEKRRTMLMSEVQRLDRQMATMRQELETLRELQKEVQAKRLRQKRARREVKQKAAGDTVDAPNPDQSYASDSEYFTDYQSVVGTDAEMDSEEFYDVHTDEDDDTLRESRNGHAAGVEPLPDEDLSGMSDKLSTSSPRNRT